VSEIGEALMLGVRFALAFVLLSASIPKLTAPDEFARAVRNYRLLPASLNRAVAAWLPRLEAALALCLLVGVAVRLAAAVAAVAFAGFALAVSINLARGRRIDCGCYSRVSPRRIGWGLVIRNLVFASLALTLVAAPPKALSLSALWSDQSSALAVADGIAVALVALAAVIALLVTDEALRVHRGIRSLSQGRGEPA
jgi:uncharacterized membrane protein YphA (DoxX/SURF4 family)